MKKDNVEIFYESTPNPHSMKFNVNKLISDETAYFEDPQKCFRSPLAQKLFGFPWAQAIYIGPHFVTVTKQDWVEWKVLADPLSDLIKEHIENGEPALLADVPQASPQTTEESSNAADENDSPVVRQIKQILNTEIRPAVAMDGGDIVFSRYENNRLYLHMQGSCSGCPSSTFTLKEGIETRLKEAIPELIEVIAE